MQSPWNSAASGLALALLSGCSDHGSRGGGAHDYVRCMAVDAPDEASGRVGAFRYTIDERTLRLEGGPARIRIGAFRGASETSPDLAEAVSGLREQNVALVFVLGGLGDDEASAVAHLDAFATLAVPVVVIPGGDDHAEAFGEAFDSRERANVFDGRRLRAISVGPARFLLLGGAPEGRYAATEGHCGHDDDDRDSLEAGEGTEYLVSWAAPSGGGREAVGRGFDGVDSGDTRVAALARELGEVGGIFAYPGTRAMIAVDARGTRKLASGAADRALRIVVPRIAGPSDERDDFGLVPSGAAILELSAEGLAFVGSVIGGGG